MLESSGHRHACFVTNHHDNPSETYTADRIDAKCKIYYLLPILAPKHSNLEYDQEVKSAVPWR